MKKQILSITATLLLTSALVFTGCKKEDTNAPVITLKGDATVTVDFKAAYTEEGATATDKDGKDNESDITSSIVTTGTVNTSSAETFSVKYNVTDEAGNTATEVVRTVNVKIKGSHMAGSFAANDLVGGSSSNYTETITASSVDENKIIVSKFAYYDNGGVYFMISGVNGTTVTIPSQTVVCGNPAASRTFTGSGTISKDGKTITLNYTESTNGSSVTGTETYTRQ